MKIAILGTKGIPNNYGGYEQFAEFFSVRLVERGHEVTVYNPSFHPFAETSYHGVTIRRKYSPEGLIGGAANFLYDFLCLRDALKQDFDIIYEAGYHSVAPSYRLLNIGKRERPIVITNMDGLEYKRSKWSSMARRLIRYLEQIAIKNSHYLISDNLGIQEYYKKQFDKESFYIPYGADPVNKTDEGQLKQFKLKQFDYLMLIARLEPENNIEMILDGQVRSSSRKLFIVVGNAETKYGRFLKEKYKTPFIVFIGGIYNKLALDSIRHFSLAYFHGHSVGGTNPSLLEAMACEAFIFAHDNVFNRHVLRSNANYFHNSSDIRDFLDNVEVRREQEFDNFRKENLNLIKTEYNWDSIVSQHEKLFTKLLQ